MITTARLVLTPLRVEDADEMLELLRDDRLYDFITGPRVYDLDDLRDRYRRFVKGAAGQTWLNWIVRLEGVAVGTVQATVTGATAQIAWIIGVTWQRRGYATEAARALVASLAQQGVTTVAAHIHPANVASQLVATRAGLHVGSEIADDGEQIWTS